MGKGIRVLGYVRQGGLILALLHGATAPALAVPDLLERQRNLATAKNLAASLQDMTYRLLKEGNQLEDTTEELVNATARWVREWDNVRASMSDEVLSDPAHLGTDLLVKLRATSDEALVLSREAKSIMAAIDSNLENLARLPLPTTQHPEHAASLTNLTTTVRLLRDSLTTVRAKAQFIVTHTNAVQTAMASYVDAKARIVIARAGLADADRIMGEVSAFLEAEAVIDPLLAKVRESYSAFSAAHTALKFYHAIDAKERLDAMEQETRAALQGARIDETYRDEALTQAKDYRDRAERQLTELQSRFSRTVIVKQFARRRALLLTPRCNQNDPALDCSLLRLLSGIPDEKIDAMNDEWLRFFEFAWDKVESPATETAS